MFYKSIVFGTMMHLYTATSGTLYGVPSFSNVHSGGGAGSSTVKPGRPITPKFASSCAVHKTHCTGTSKVKVKLSLCLTN
jgi:hypothetical protein